MTLTEYRPGATFPGRIPPTVGEPEQTSPTANRGTPDAPNVVVLNGAGQGRFGCSGSPIRTANLD